MKKFSIVSTLVFSALCAPLFLSCSSDDSKKDDDDGTEYAFCVFEEEEMCLPGPVTKCPVGAILFNDCLESYTDMRTIAGSSSSWISPNPTNSSSSSELSSSSGPPQIPGTFGENNKFLDPRDGEEYDYVISGLRVWMLQNLNYSRDNTIGLCYGVVDVTSENATKENCNDGRFYDYSTARDGNPPQGLCPDGWQIPSLEEWRTVETGLQSGFYLMSGHYNATKWQDKGIAGHYWTSEAGRLYVSVECDGVGSNCMFTGTSTNLIYNSIRCVTKEAIGCGNGQYNPANAFCLQNIVYPRCGGLIYPETKFCGETVAGSRDTIITKCGGKIYDFATEGCLSEVVFPKCGSDLYSGKNHFCDKTTGKDTILAKCGGEEYAFATQDCFKEQVFSRCGAALFEPETHFCSGTGAAASIYLKCGGENYNPQSQFCSGSAIVAKCGTALYNPATQDCLNGAVRSKCGSALLPDDDKFCGKTVDGRDTIVAKCGGISSSSGTAYNLATHFCSSGGTIFEKCGGEAYNPLTEGCSGGVKLPKCGSALFPPDATNYFCSGTTIYQKCGGEVYNPATQECVDGVVMSLPPVFSEDFEGVYNWSMSYSGTNRWIVGTATYHEGSKSAYITNDGSSYTYTITSASSNSNFYRTVTFPSSADNFTLSFYWKGAGESSFDNMSVYLVPDNISVTSVMPSVDYRIGNTYYSGNSNWNLVNINLSAATYSGRTYKLVFHWKNDTSGGAQPPAAIDDIKIIR